MKLYENYYPPKKEVSQKNFEPVQGQGIDPNANNPNGFYKSNNASENEYPNNYQENNYDYLDNNLNAKSVNFDFRPKTR